ncbi:hypothetical protein LX36DRAFT_587732 [Colletotrichum falcatum]|nr:hypothetical protein LX36DRAFT_587732 [Colletotrichum falcatum]
MITKSLCIHCCPAGRNYHKYQIDLHNMCLVDKKWNQAATAHLYHVFHSDLSNRFLDFLRTLIERPNLAIHVKSVILVPGWPTLDIEKQTALNNMIKARALALGLPFADQDLDCNLRSVIDGGFQNTLENMLLLHTPNIVTIDICWEDIFGNNAFKYLNVVARRSQQWNATSCLRHAKLEVSFVEDNAESHHMTFLSTLSAVAPNLQELEIILKSAYSTVSRLQSYHRGIAANHPQMVNTTDMVFLSSLRSLVINNHELPPCFEITLGRHIHHCKSLEEIYYRFNNKYLDRNTDPSMFLRLLQPISRSLKRLSLVVLTRTPNDTVWDFPSLAYVAGFRSVAMLTSLEVLRFNTFAYDCNRISRSPFPQPSMIVPFMCALPKSLRVLSFGGGGSCELSHLKHGLSQLRDRVQDGMLPNLRTLHVFSDGILGSDPFFGAFSMLGVDTKACWYYEMGGQKANAMLEAEGWTQRNGFGGLF